MSLSCSISHTEISRREEVARFQLGAICRQMQLPHLLKRFKRWAVVGGTVRDVLLKQDLQNCLLSFEFPDIDVAVDAPVSDKHFLHYQCSMGNLRIGRNHFGGLKLHSQTTGEVDVWTWTSRQTAFSCDYLMSCLNSVDFGINAVAFLWPEEALVVHPQWYHDLEHRLVEKLAPSSPNPAFQPVRACALAANLGMHCKRKFNLGKGILKDLRKWSSCSGTDISAAVGYLEEKVFTGRWPQPYAARFAVEIKKMARTNVGRSCSSRWAAIEAELQNLVQLDQPASSAV